MKIITHARYLKWFFLILAFVSAAAYAHKPSDSYLSVQMDGRVIHGQWDIALRDLDFAIGLDQDGNGELTWNEVRSKHPDIAAYAMSRLALKVDGKACQLNLQPQLIDQHTDGTYTVIKFDSNCVGEQLDVDYHLLFDLDPQHKGLLKLVDKDGGLTTAIFSLEQPSQHFGRVSVSKLKQFQDYLLNGVWHIWIGFDHIFFLLSLLFPAVLLWNGRKWDAVTSFKAALFDVLKIVTAFTLAHSITLTLATLQVVSLPSRWVESTIALSVVLAALNNIYPLFHGKRWLVAFCFGLIHGFGFASVLTDLGLPSSALALSLVGFNVGVELGQLSIVAVFLPTAFLIRKHWVYRQFIFTLGSVLITIISGIWLIERVFNEKWIPI